MRSPRRFQPAVDCLQVRITPSALLPVAPVSGGTLVLASMMDDTGSPGTLPSGDGSYPIIMTSPDGGGGTGTVC
jgi:hypothetical protein